MTSSSAAKKKYKLFSATSEDGSKLPCAFFGTPAGCRLGDNCKFLHSTAPAKQEKSKPAIIPSTNSSVSSEESDSENEPHFLPAPPAPSSSYASLANEKKDETDSGKKKKKKRKRDTEDSNSQIFAKPKKTVDVFESPKHESNGKAKKDKKEKKKSSAPEKVVDAPEKEPSPKKKSKKDKKNSQEVVVRQQSGPDFLRSLNLPIAKFCVPLAEVKKEKEVEKETKKQKREKKALEEETKKVKREESSEDDDDDDEPQSSSESSISVKYVVPHDTEVGRKWKDVVAKSQSNPDFATTYDFSKYKKQDIPGDAWIKAKPFGDWCGGFPQAIAIDCEMCETEDPVSKQKNPNALCRISVIDAENPDQVLIDTLVKPAWPVTDYRTWVNGLSKEDLDPVQFTTRHAQAFMVALCSDQTVILGHAVHNDLAAMRMEHYCVGDSALLFQANDSETATVSLKDLAQSILQKEMPLVHDSVNDARASLACLDHYREKKGDVEKIVRTSTNRRRGTQTHHQLFVHRIPKMCKPSHLHKMFVEHTAIAPEEVEDIDFASKTGKTHVNFKSKNHAMLAFDALEGPGEKDKSGRMQKKVYLRGGDYIRIRKMNFEDGHEFPDGKIAGGNKSP